MPIAIGDTLPDATFRFNTADGPQSVTLQSLTSGRKVVIFGLPGAFTGTCSSAHLPSFMRTRSQFGEKGIDEVICLSVNDIFVMDAWDKAHGANDAGITMLTDPDAGFGRAIDMVFDAPDLGLLNRMSRFALVADNGVVTHWHAESAAGVCDRTAGEALLDAL